MKHIKKYSLFESYESPKEIEMYLKDIFQELEDNGFSIEIDQYPVDIGLGLSYRQSQGKISDFTITIKKKQPENWMHSITYQYSDISDYIDSAIDYMSTVEYEIQWSKSSSLDGWKYSLPGSGKIKTSIVIVDFVSKHKWSYVKIPS